VKSAQTLPVGTAVGYSTVILFEVPCGRRREWKECLQRAVLTPTGASAVYGHGKAKIPISDQVRKFVHDEMAIFQLEKNLDGADER
jgi:hypothetical protein